MKVKERVRDGEKQIRTSSTFFFFTSGDRDEKIRREHERKRTEYMKRQCMCKSPN